MPNLNNGKKKESHAEAELRRDLKKAKPLTDWTKYFHHKTYKISIAGAPPVEAIWRQNQKHWRGAQTGVDEKLKEDSVEEAFESNDCRPEQEECRHFKIPTIIK